MRAMQIIELGKPLQMNEVEKPTPAAGEVLLRIHTCGLNFGDLLIMKGTYQEKPPLPATIGMELCGTVEALGAGVTHLKVACAMIMCLSTNIPSRKKSRHSSNAKH